MLEKIRDILSEYTVVDQNKMIPSAKLIQDLNMSSLDVVNAVVDFEDTFDIEVNDRDIKDIHTVQDIIDYLKRKGVTE
jgi:acyl carrier protein